MTVSTHSRPKAAGEVGVPIAPNQLGFNTQPPEGGWSPPPSGKSGTSGFNTQPPEGGWDPLLVVRQVTKVSTHSRPKAAGYYDNYYSAS